MSYLGLFLAGLTDSYNPCSVGVLLISLTILIGLGRRNLIAIFGLSYLTTIFLTYFLIGLGIFNAFHLFGVHGFFGYAAGIILIVLGFVSLLPKLFNRIPLFNWINSCHMPKDITKRIEGSVFMAGVVLGFLIGLCTVPCAGGIYMGAIALLATRVNYWRALFGIFLFNIGFIIPLMIIFIVSSRPKVLDKIQKFSIQISSYSKYAISIIMIVMGIILLLISSR